MRIARMIARAGVCSRRDAERLIEAGSVMVNGKLLKSPAFNVSASDIVLVNGKLLPVSEPVRLWRYHKPRGRVTSHKDPQGRPTVFDALPDHLPRVISVGRLDYNTEGLMLLTTDGGLARHLELPATGWRRRYKVRAFGRISQAQLDGLKNGLTIDGVRYGEISAQLERDGNNPWINMSISEGKNREIRRILEHLGMKVSRLIRLSYGPFQLSELKTGSVEEVKRRVLAEQLGKELTDQFELGPKPQVRRTAGAASPSVNASSPKAKTKPKPRKKPPFGGKKKKQTRR
ncbi:MAG: rRNA pseudouridine synthase [bacterium]|nr:rRNA pseudouridine synthase [bacterium]